MLNTLILACGTACRRWYCVLLLRTSRKMSICGAGLYRAQCGRKFRGSRICVLVLLGTTCCSLQGTTSSRVHTDTYTSRKSPMSIPCSLTRAPKRMRVCLCEGRRACDQCCQIPLTTARRLGPGCRHDPRNKLGGQGEGQHCEEGSEGKEKHQRRFRCVVLCHCIVGWHVHGPCARNVRRRRKWQRGSRATFCWLYYVAMVGWAIYEGHRSPLDDNLVL